MVLAMLEALCNPSGLGVRRRSVIAMKRRYQDQQHVLAQPLFPLPLPLAHFLLLVWAPDGAVVSLAAVLHSFEVTAILLRVP